MSRTKPKGWIYLITNRAMPDLVKIGFSMKDPSLRAQELQNTGVPHPYDVVYEALVPEPYVLEQRVHRALAEFREGKEWFRCNVAIAYEAIRSIASPNILFDSTNPREARFNAPIGELAFRAWETSHDLDRLYEAVRHHYVPALEYAISFFRANPTLNTAKLDLAVLKRELYWHYVSTGIAGDASAYFEAVCLAEDDEDCAVSKAEVDRLLRLSAEGGCVAAVGRLAVDAIENGKTSEDVFLGIEKLEQLLNEGDWSAGLSLATFYEQGKVVPMDRHRALNYWNKVASLSGATLWRDKAERLRTSLLNGK